MSVILSVPGRQVEVDQRILGAIALRNSYGHFGLGQLRCRIIQSETDEGYPIDGREDLEIYATVDDPQWQRDEAVAQGGHPGPYGVQIYRRYMPIGQDPIEYLRRMAADILRDKRVDYETYQALLEPTGIR